MSGGLGDFLLMVSALSKGTVVPEEDAIDIRNGAKQIPDQVTNARRAGQIVPFTQEGQRSEWYWTLPGNVKVYHGNWS